MFDNSLVLTGFPAGGVSVTDTDNGRTVRRHNAGGGVFYEVVIAHSESNENKIVVTDRHLVQTNYITQDGVSQKPVRASCGLTFAYPRIGGVSHAEMLNCYLANLNFIIGGFAQGTIDNASAKLLRLFSGES